MFFLLRCVFWLTIVYSSMDWSGSGLNEMVGPRSAEAGVRACLASDLCAGVATAATRTVTRGAHAPDVAQAGIRATTLKAGDLALPWRGPSKG